MLCRTGAQLNNLLASLPPDELDRLLPNLELVNLKVGQVMAFSGQAMSHAYFPTTAILSMLYVMENGDSAETAMVGRDGIVGISLFLGGGETHNSTVVQNAGQAYRVASRHLAAEFDRHASMMRILLVYTQTLVTQMTQTAACNRHHRLDQQLCRWLLLRVELLGTCDLAVTHSLIANMLGVRREGVTTEAGKLQAAGVIRYKRGRMQVLERTGLEKVVCECFAVVKKEYGRMLPWNAKSPHSRNEHSA